MTQAPECAARPREITVELTNRCNLSCAMCPRRFAAMREGFMSERTLGRVCAAVREARPDKLIPFFRGESLLHPRFDEFFGKLAKLRIPMLLATNAHLLTARRARLLLDSPLSFLSFSVDTIDPAAYRAQRRGNLTKVLANIDRFLALRAQCRSGLIVQVSSVKTRENSAQLDAFVRFWRGRVDRVRLYREHSQEGRFGALQGRKNCRRPCHKIFRNSVILWDGTYALCNHDWATSAGLGNIRRHSLASVWRGRKYAALRRGHTQGTIPADCVCADCAHWRDGYDDTAKGELYE